jgi:glycosyltransferase involved in cell wall biosynthesis
MTEMFDPDLSLNGATPAAQICCVILAHNEEQRIARCLASLPLGEPGVEVHVLVNGSRDATAQKAREAAKGHASVHEYNEPGKARSWNRFMLDAAIAEAECFVFVDGDAEIELGSAQALANALAANPEANAAAGFPRNGRRAKTYCEELTRDREIFGDLYALSGRFVEKLRAENVRLPEDLVGDDSLICALAKTDGEAEDQWQDERIIPCPAAGFYCEPTDFSPDSMSNQYRRMINYSVRHFQNRIISHIMRGEGPKGLPRRLADLYPQWLPRFAPRKDPQLWWFDRKALERMSATLPQPAA